jgi:hypothetical protein
VGVLRGILADAVADRMLAANPAAGVKLPKRPPARHVYLTAGQLDRLADECGQYGSLVLLLGALSGRALVRRRRCGWPTSTGCIVA